MNYNAFFEQSLDALKSAGNYRYFASLERLVGKFPQVLYHKDGLSKEVVVWCSNDYLGMGHHPDVIKAMVDSIQDVGAGAGGTRNIAGTMVAHEALELEIADLHAKESALIFTSGYVANETAIATLTSKLPNCITFSDEQNHASIIHGIRSGRAEKKIFRHNDLDHLRELLSASDPAASKLIIFESIYSMTGSFGKIEEICALAKEFGALTYLDEVHAVGLYGNKGGGVAQMQGLEDQVDIIQGTLGKAYGLIGGYIAANKSLVDFVRSFAPGFIFTTALPPAIAAGAKTSIAHLKVSPQERTKHQERVAYVKQMLKDYNIPTKPTSSHIIPVLVADAHKCRQASRLLLEEEGIFVQAINYPTVPWGQECLRVTPTPLHSDEHVKALCESLKSVFEKLDIQGLSKAA